MTDQLGGEWGRRQTRSPFAFLNGTGTHEPFWFGPMWCPRSDLYQPISCSTGPGVVVDDALREGIR